MYAATYDASGRLLSAQVYQETLAPDAVQLFTEEKSKEANADKVMVFVWQNAMYKMEPFGANSCWSSRP